MEDLDPSLQRFLQLHVAVAGRDDEALRQCLRAVALELPDKNQHRIVQMLTETLDDRGRAFLQSIHH